MEIWEAALALVFAVIVFRAVANLSDIVVMEVCWRLRERFAVCDRIFHRMVNGG